MKNFFKWLGIIAVVAIIGLVFAACDDIPEDELDGTTWVAHPNNAVTLTIRFTKPVFIFNQDAPGGGQSYTLTGTYTISGSTVTLKYDNGTTLTGTLSGNTLEISNYATFTKQ